MGRPFLWDAPRGAPLAANPGGGAGPPPRPPASGRKSQPRLRRPPLFGLAPGGVCRAAPVAGGAVRSCRTLSPLPGARRGRAVCFLWHFPWGRPRRPLTGTVVPVEPGLSSSPGARPGPAAVRPPGAPRYARAAPRASMLPSVSPCSAATAARRASVAASAAPSTRSGRQRRWKADSSTGKGRSAR